MLVAGGAFGEAMVSSYGWSGSTLRTWQLLRWPVGVALLVFAIAVLLDHAPRRRQPALSWLALGAGVAVLLTLLATGALAVYVHVSSSFGSTYGPLAGIIVLLLWSLVSAMAFFYGVAVCAQLEAVRAGDHSPVYDDPGRPHGHVVGELTRLTGRSGAPPRPGASASGAGPAGSSPASPAGPAAGAGPGRRAPGAAPPASPAPR